MASCSSARFALWACVSPVAIVRPLQLDEEALTAERARELCGDNRRVDGEAVAGAAGEADKALVQLAEQPRVELRRHGLRRLRPRLPVRGGEQAAEVRVAVRRLDQQRDVRAARKAHLGARDRPYAEGLRRVGELERAA